jgi:hypothetical protein
MKKTLVVAVVAGSFFSFEAHAQDRAGSAALGAVSGAVVLGPVGAVAGAVIGYTAGPSIARSWGIGQPAPRSRARHATPSRVTTRESRTQESRTQPPGLRESQAKSLGANAQVVTSGTPPAVKTSERPSGTSVAPPVQGFD